MKYKLINKGLVIFTLGYSFLSSCSVNNTSSYMKAESERSVDYEDMLNVEYKSISTSDRRMDELAWLLEGTSKCAAVSIIGNKFYIASNEFFSGTESVKNNSSLKYVYSIMNHFKCIANNSYTNNEVKIENRDRLMQEHCKRHFNSEFSGFFKINDSVLEKVVTTEVLRNKTGKSSLFSELAELSAKKKIELEPEYHKALGFGLDVYRRILKIENFINKARQNEFSHSFNKEQLEAFKNFSYSDDKEGRKKSNILFLEDEKDVHAEMQILSILIQMMENRDPAISDLAKLYIGISKLCCLECYCMLCAANDVLKATSVELRFKGAHKESFNWKFPLNFKMQPGESDRKSKYKSLKSSNESTFNKIKKIYEEKVNNEKKKENELSKKTYNMRGSKSSSEISVTEDDKLLEYKSNLENSLSLLKTYDYDDQNCKMLKLGLELCEINTFKDLFKDSIDLLDREVIFYSLYEGLEAIENENDLVNFLTNPKFSTKEIVELFENFPLNKEEEKETRKRVHEVKKIAEDEDEDGERLEPSKKNKKN